VYTKHILIVDDDALMRRSLAFNLENAGYRVSTSGNAEDALALSRRDVPDIVLLDIGLPGMDGLDALKIIKERFALPVIFLTARRRELDEVLGLELGADDYITKPFELEVLLARIKAALRHFDQDVLDMKQANKNRVEVGDLVIDPDTHLVTRKGIEVELAPREFDLLHAMALEAGKVLSPEELLGRVWGAEYVGESQVVYVHIRWLREKLEENPHTPERIITIRGVGYKLVPKVN
jgi:DNA-binding response OmpR family regulator